MTAHVLAMALLAVAAADPLYFTFQQYNTNDQSCGSADTTATTTIWAYNTCSQTKDGQSTKIFTDSNNITITTYPNTGCNGTGVVSFSAPLNTCSKYNGQGGKFTASNQPYAVGCWSLKAPYEVTYTDSSCTGFPAKVTAQMAACFDKGGAGGASSRQQCFNGTAQECIYGNDNCQGDGSCNPLSNVPTNTCSDYKKFVCPVDNHPFCPAVATTKKSKKNVATPIGGIVAAVILIPLIIIGVAVVIFVIMRRSKASDADGSIMGGGKTTYGSA